MAYINLGSYYIFGLPLGFVLGYVANMGVRVMKFQISLSLIIFCVNASLLSALHSKLGLKNAGTLGRDDCRGWNADFTTTDCSLQNQLD